jgi:hypothetical protein
VCDGMKVVVKAVHRRSRELDVIKELSTSPLRDCAMNHCIRKKALSFLLRVSIPKFPKVNYNFLCFDSGS